MNLLERGKLAEARGEFSTAIEFYEKAVEGEESPGEELAYMLVLCWRMTEFGFNSGHHIPVDSVHGAGQKLADLLDLSSRYACCVEVQFWRAYVAWADLGEDLSVGACTSWTERRPDFLDPLVFVAQRSHGAVRGMTARRLIDRFGAEETARARYLSSVAEAVLRRTEEQ